MRLRLTVLVIAALSCSRLGAEEKLAKLDPGQPYRARKSSPVTYNVDFAAIITPPYKAKVLKVWMPIPPSDEAQQVSDSTFTTFSAKVEPRIGTEKLFGNTFAYFEFSEPQGAQIIHHRFKVKTWQLDWELEPTKVAQAPLWPDNFKPYLRGEPLIPVDDRVAKLVNSIVKEKTNPIHDVTEVMDWVNRTMTYSHEDCSLQGSALHALEKKVGHCSDYHGLCAALGRSLGYPARIVYGINPYPKNSPSHCKLEVFLPTYGWVSFDVSETQQLIGRIKKDGSLKEEDKERLIKAAQARLRRGFRDNTWFLQTRGSDYDLVPPATKKVAVVRTIYAEADGVPYPEPDPANPKQRSLTWMTAHSYAADRTVTNLFQDWRSLEPTAK